MEFNPIKRITAAEALKHPWLERKVHNQFDVQIAKETFENMQIFRV